MTETTGTSRLTGDEPPHHLPRDSRRLRSRQPAVTEEMQLGARGEEGL